MMDQFNLNLYVEQVNHNADTTTVENWKEENVEQALSSVVDPNTEFKTEIPPCGANRASPSDSYGLDDTRCTSSNFSTSPVSPDTTSDLNEEVIPKRRTKRQFHDSSELARVHAYGASHLDMPNKKMKNISPELIKYPADRITIVTENGIALSQESLQPVTNSEQLTWILQRARDRLDTASNISGCSSRFDLDSNCSEKVETMSTISDVSGYEEEMYRIKRLLLLDSAASTPTPVPTPVHKEKYDTELQKLTTELQKIKAEWQEKHQEALRQKAHTEGRLETMQVEMLETRDHESALKAEVARLQQSLRDVSAQSELKDVEVERLRSDSQNLEQENERLRIELQEVRIDVESKEGSITGLKNKIADQHVKFQELYQYKLKTEYSLSSLRNELESMRKSNSWYQDQLHACQSAKLKIQQELMANQSSTVSLMHQLEKMKSECAGLRVVAEQTQLQAVREKEVLMRKLEAIQADMLEREAIIMSSQCQHTDTPNVVTSRTENETEKPNLPQLQELQEQMSSLSLQVQAKEAVVKQMESENTELLTRLTVAQKMLNEKELTIQMLENKFRNVEMSQNQLIETLKQKEDALLEARNDKVTAEVALAAAEREKSEIDTAVNKLREHFSTVTQCYKSMKEEVREKEKKIANLTNKVTSLEKENEKLKDEACQYKEMQSQISQLKSFEAEIKQLTDCNRDLSNKVREITEANDYIKSKLANAEEILTAREEQLLNQSHSLEAQHNEINLLQNEKENKVKEFEELNAKLGESSAEIADLNEKILALENNLRTAKEKLVEQQNEMESQNNEKDKLVLKIQELEFSNTKLTDHASSLMKQLASANAAIEQFNLLCRQSEEDRHHISDELKKVLKENASLKSTTENGLINPGAYKINELIEKMELELFAFMNVQNEVEKIPDLRNVFSKLIVMQELLSKVINVKEEGGNLISNKRQYIDAATQNDLLLCSDVSLQTENILKNVVNATQTNAYKINELIEKMELELFAFMNVQNEVEKIPDLRNVFSKLIVMQELLSKVINVKEEGGNLISNKRQYIDAATQNDLLLCSDVSLQTENILKNVVNATQTDNSPSCICAETQTECDIQTGQMESLERQVVNLKASLRMCELEQREKHRRYEANVRTLLKKVKEHMKGRKAAEKTLEEVKDHGDVARLQAELEEMQRLANKNQETILQLEKERGKLVQTQDDTSPSLKDERIAELEEEIRKSHIIIKDLRKEVFSDKCEISQLKKQLASVQLGLETANEMLDAKNVELGRTMSVQSVLRSDLSRLNKQLEAEEREHEACSRELDNVRAELENSKAKDPVLADQMKTLSCHLHQKSQEIAALEDKLKLSEEQWQTTTNSLRLNIGALQDEVSRLHSELDVVRKDKVALQKHAAELRTALHSSMENNKMLRARLERDDCDNKEKMPDLTSSLPMPPLEYDETKIAELLHQSSLLPQSKPLSNLQACLDSLKQEMATLQQQLIAKAMPKEEVETSVNSSS